MRAIRLAVLRSLAGTAIGVVASVCVADVSTAPATADTPADFMRACSYRLWYPWYVANQSKPPEQPAAPRPEPDGPRDPAGERCLAQLRDGLHRSGRPLPSDAEIVELRAAAKAGKAAALYQAYDELKAARQKR